MRAATGQLWNRTPPVWKAMLSLAAFSGLGGVGGAMLTGEPLVGAGAYYALAVLGLCSPEGAVLRRTLKMSAARSARPPEPETLGPDQ